MLQSKRTDKQHTEAVSLPAKPVIDASLDLQLEKAKAERLADLSKGISSSALGSGSLMFILLNAFTNAVQVY